MKFCAVITLFMAAATAAPLLGDAAGGALGTVAGVPSHPTAKVGKVEDNATGLMSSVGKNDNSAVGNTGHVANGLLGPAGGLLQPATGLLEPVTELLKPVTDLLKPITGTVDGLLGGVVVKN